MFIAGAATTAVRAASGKLDIAKAKSKAQELENLHRDIPTIAEAVAEITSEVFANLYEHNLTVLKSIDSGRHESSLAKYLEELDPMWSDSLTLLDQIALKNSSAGAPRRRRTSSERHDRLGPDASSHAISRHAPPSHTSGRWRRGRRVQRGRRTLAAGGADLVILLVSIPAFFVVYAGLLATIATCGRARSGDRDRRAARPRAWAGRRPCRRTPSRDRA